MEDSKLENKCIKLISEMMDEEDKLFNLERKKEEEAEIFYGISVEEKEKRILDNPLEYCNFSIAELTKMTGLQSKKVCEIAKIIKS